MKYRDLIQFDPIDEIIKFSKLGSDDYRAKIVKDFVCSKAYEERIIPQICAKLDQKVFRLSVITVLVNHTLCRSSLS